MEKVAGYVRVSRVAGREGDSFQSPNAQEDAIRALAQARGFEVAEVAHELDASGGTMNRPELQRLISAIESGDVAGIVVARLDRFGRTVAGISTEVERIRQAGGFVVSADGIIDTATGGAIGDAIRNLLATFAQMERDLKSEGFESAKSNAVARGVHVAGTVPVGYLRGEDKRLVLDPAKADAIRRAFELRAGGASFEDVARLLDAELPGGPSGKSGRWHLGTVTRLLANPVYTGEARQGKHANPAAHDAIISRRILDACEAIRQARAAAAAPEHGPRGSALLSSLARCGSCGHAMARTSSGGGYRVYHCKNRSCSAQASCGEAKLDALVTEATREALLPKIAGLSKLRQVAGNTPEQVAAHEAVETARVEREALLDPKYAAAIGPEQFAALISRADATIAEAEHALAAAVGEIVTGGGALDVESAELWTGTADEFEARHVDERRDAISGVVARVVVSRSTAPRGTRVDLAERVAIEWRDAEPKARPNVTTLPARKVRAA